MAQTPYCEIREFLRVNISGISCGPTHSMAWSLQGQLWTWGDHTDGKLGYMVYGPDKDSFTANQVSPVVDI